MRSRIGLVLGTGGVLGAAWMTGALAALQDRLPVPAGRLDVLVGTSAGSVLVAALRSGLSVQNLVDYQRGGPTCALRALGSPDLGEAALPAWPRLRLGSPRLLLAALRAPRRVHPWVAASACLPQGQTKHDRLRAMLRGLTGLAGPAVPWPATGQTWIVAVDYDSGRRVAFGRHGAPPACLPDAVVASCSVPGWFRPAAIGARRYVDGGVRSPSSADLLARSGLDEVYVLAATASMVSSRARSPWEWAERRIRSLMTGALRREVNTLRSAGIRVTVLTPGPEDLAVMGANLMDPGRRATVFDSSLRTSVQALAAASQPARALRSVPA